MGRPRYERKTSLTFEEKITAAFMHYVRDIDQQDIAMMYGVNGGRVNEACVTVSVAFGMRPGVNKIPRPGWDQAFIEDLPLKKEAEG